MELLRIFLKEDCDSFTARTLLREIAKREETDTELDHTTNRFNLRLNFKMSLVFIQDDIDPSEAGELTVSLVQFKTMLESKISASA